MKEKIGELFQNQSQILEAVKNLNERLLIIEKKAADVDEVKEIIDTQSTIDEILVKNCDDIALILKGKKENENAMIRLDKEIASLSIEVKRQVEDLEYLKRINEENVKIKPKLDHTVCKFNDRGYCRNKTSCEYLHQTSICQFFLKDGKCLQQNCPSRHPKQCKYWRRGYCFRGVQCKYRHGQEYIDQFLDENEEMRLKEINCENCDVEAYNLYYCNYCERNFCANCTIKEAHDKSYSKSTQINNCKQIHKSTELADDKNDENINDDLDASMEAHHCQCGKTNDIENYQCKDCEKIFSEDCPSRPVGLHCIECYLEERSESI